MILRHKYKIMVKANEKKIYKIKIVLIIHLN